MDACRCCGHPYLSSRRWPRGRLAQEQIQDSGDTNCCLSSNFGAFTDHCCPFTSHQCDNEVGVFSEQRRKFSLLLQFNRPTSNCTSIFCHSRYFSSGYCNPRRKPPRFLPRRPESCSASSFPKFNRGLVL